MLRYIQTDEKRNNIWSVDKKTLFSTEYQTTIKQDIEFISTVNFVLSSFTSSIYRFSF